MDRSTVGIWICFSSCIILHRDSFFALDAIQRRFVVGSAVAAGAILSYVLQKRRQLKSIPVGEGWWRAGEKQLSQDEMIYPFQVQTSDEEIKVFFSVDVKIMQIFVELLKNMDRL